MIQLDHRKNTPFWLNKYEWILLSFALIYAIYWQMVSPIQYTGDSEGYLGVAHMLLGQSAYGIAPIFRAPGYPILLVLTGVVIPGTFALILFIQAFFSAIIPVIIYRILNPFSPYIAMIAATFAVLTGTTTVHTSQIMTEPLFTLLLFLGLSIAIKIVRTPHNNPALLYWLSFIFASLNTVRPIAWPMFWLFLIIIVCNLWRQDRLAYLWRAAFGSAILFMSLMCLWGIADDVFLSNGARYSPLTTVRAGEDSRLESYLYDLPFIEAYFSPWTKRVENISHASSTISTLKNKPEMTKIHSIVLKQLTKNRDIFLQEKSIYSYQLFGKYANQPQQLADRIFDMPNYAYANYVRSAVEQYNKKEKRLALYYSAAKEAQRNWPRRWLGVWKNAPLLPLMGPSHGNGSQRFLLAYTSLPHYLPAPAANHYRSLINKENGPATDFMLTTLTETLRNSPELWRGTSGLFGSYVENPEALTQAIMNNPNQQNAWEITVMLWDLLGYNTMSNLLDQVAFETFAIHKKPLILRIWDTALMVSAGPGYIEFDNLGPQFGQVEIYDYLETAQLTKREKVQLHSTQKRYNNAYTKWQSPITNSYFLFYLCKPLFLFTSIISLTILWARKQTMIVPFMLILPYSVSVAIYSVFLTALPRYTDPTLLLPFLVTMLTLPECRRIWLERKLLM